MSESAIVPIVEGHSEVASVPLLLRRLLNEFQCPYLQIARPVRVHRNRVVKEGEVEKAVTLARRTREKCRAVMVLLDANDDCPAKLGPALLERIIEAHSDLAAAVVLAKKEFECWFLGGLESLRGVRGIVEDAVSVPNPEEIRGAKERLSQFMTNDLNYVEVDDQPALAAKFDFSLARKQCPSFDKFIRDFERLISLIGEEER